MANQYDTQVLENGPRNLIVKCTGLLDTTDQGPTIMVSPGLCASYVPENFRIDKVIFTVSPQIAVQLWWEGTPNVLILSITENNEFCYKDAGGVQNPAYMPTGNILFTTTGYSSGVQSYTVNLHLVKIGD